MRRRWQWQELNLPWTSVPVPFHSARSRWPAIHGQGFGLEAIPPSREFRVAYTAIGLANTRGSCIPVSSVEAFSIAILILGWLNQKYEIGNVRAIGSRREWPFQTIVSTSRCMPVFIKKRKVIDHVEMVTSPFCIKHPITSSNCSTFSAFSRNVEICCIGSIFRTCYIPSSREGPSMLPFWRSCRACASRRSSRPISGPLQACFFALMLAYYLIRESRMSNPLKMF